MLHWQVPRSFHERTVSDVAAELYGGAVPPPVVVSVTESLDYLEKARKHARTRARARAHAHAAVHMHTCCHTACVTA